MSKATDAIDTAWGYSPFMVRWARLAYFLAYLGAIYALLWWHESSPTEDGWLLIVIGAIYALAVLVMLIGTRYWTIRGLGLLGTLAGDAVAYTTLGGAALGWFDVPEWRLDLVRALFLGGGSLMVAGLLLWLWRTRGGTRDEPDGVIV
jgi:hypothetical protein